MDVTGQRHINVQSSLNRSSLHKTIIASGAIRFFTNSLDPILTSAFVQPKDSRVRNLNVPRETDLSKIIDEYFNGSSHQRNSAPKQRPRECLGSCMPDS